MTHLAVFTLSLLGFAALALAMERHQDDLFGRALPRRTTLALRIASWAALLLAMVFAVRAQGWSLGLVTLSGHSSLCAGLVFIALVLRQRIAR